MFKGKKAAFYTLGCKLNFSETSTISRQIADMGFVNLDVTDNAITITTCFQNDCAADTDDVVNVLDVAE